MFSFLFRLNNEEIDSIDKVLVTLDDPLSSFSIVLFLVSLAIFYYIFFLKLNFGLLSFDFFVIIY